MLVLDLIFGVCLICAGRNFFWLCVGIVGFLMGVQCSLLLGISNGWLAIVSALALGSIGVVLAISFEWLAVVIGVGFLGGGYLLSHLFPFVNGQDPYAWPIFVVGGIIGTCLMVIAFDWALIVISTLLGATLIANAVDVSEQLRILLFIVCLVIGIAVQYAALRGDEPPVKRPSRS